MFKGIMKTIILGLASGGACAAGTWAWKNYVEPKVEELKQKNEEEKKKEQPAH